MNDLKTFKTNFDQHSENQVHSWMNMSPEATRQAYYSKSSVSPTLVIPRDGEVKSFVEDIDNNVLFSLPVPYVLTGEEKTMDELKDEFCFDSIVVHYDGKLSVKWFCDQKYKNSQHLIQSNSKSLVAVLYGILVSRGLIDPEKVVTD
ncbi:MAG: hypothetical protein HN416_12910, partial [Nitrospina sp.]|nr:hypothetical protein [Nitrospina sp.]